MLALTRKHILPLMRAALREDTAWRDLTSRAVLPASARIRARLLAKSPGVLAGAPVAAWAFQALDSSVRCAIKSKEGAALTPGRTILTVEGRARSIFAAERTALNFLGHMSGIATMTRAFARYARGTPVFDTRKTLPGLRAVEKYAVRIGGGCSHRGDLSEAILIKTNHLKVLWYGARGTGRGKDKTEIIKKAIARAKRKNPTRFVEIEVTSFSEFKSALAARPHAILLDNWRIQDIRKAVLLFKNPPPPAPRPMPLLEVSGGVTIGNVGAIARTGVDRISIGRLTHSAPSLDVSLEVMT